MTSADGRPATDRISRLLFDVRFGDRDAFEALCEIVGPQINAAAGEVGVESVLVELWQSAPRYVPTTSGGDWISGLIERVTGNRLAVSSDHHVGPMTHELRDIAHRAAASPQEARVEETSTRETHWLWSGRGVALIGAALAVLVLVVSLAGGGATTSEQILAADDGTSITRQIDGADARLVYSPSLEGAVIVFDDLPVLDGSTTYQLWVFDGDVAMSAGIFRSAGPGTTVMPTEVVTPSSEVGLSIENAGGAERPGDLIARWDIG